VHAPSDKKKIKKSTSSILYESTYISALVWLF